MPEYRTPGVYIEEISGGPRPVQPSSTTTTGFIGVLTLPTTFVPGRELAAGMMLPAAEEQPLLAWNRALSFRGLAAAAGAPEAPAAAAAPADDGKGSSKSSSKSTPRKPAAPTGTRFERLIKDALPGNWTVSPPDGNNVTLVSDKKDMLRIPVSRTLMSVHEGPSGDVWELAWGADEVKMLELVRAHALNHGLKHSGNLDAVDASGSPATLDIDAIHTQLTGPAPSITGMTGFIQWRQELGENLFKEILIEGAGVNAAKAQTLWDSLDARARKAWDQWLRSHPGMHRMEIALQGFFENGGATAYPAVCIQPHNAGGPNKRSFLEASFDSQPSVAMLCAPGLDQAWQQGILEYAGPKGRGDLFAILETPRYLLTRAPRGVNVGKFRWTEGHSPYEMGVLETSSSAATGELRFLGYANDELLDRVVPRDDNGYGAAYGPWLIVENPLSTGAHDRFVYAPPSGHVAGVIAATDLKAGGGVHKAPANEQVAGVTNLVTEISDKEQGSLNVKGINIIRHRPGGGIRIWGARTTGADALWRYVNVRRLFLFVERSVRDAVNWAVFLPNNDRTRRDLATTIRSFLYSLWNQGMLDGASHSDAYSVKSDKENNPDVDVRSGILTVDVMFRPVYPAEFIRIRFRQTPMEVPE